MLTGRVLSLQMRRRNEKPNTFEASIGVELISLFHRVLLIKQLKKTRSKLRRSQQQWCRDRVVVTLSLFILKQMTKRKLIKKLLIKRTLSENLMIKHNFKLTRPSDWHIKIELNKIKPGRQARFDTFWEAVKLSRSDWGKGGIDSYRYRERIVKPSIILFHKEA